MVEIHTAFPVSHPNTHSPWLPSNIAPLWEMKYPLAKLYQIDNLKRQFGRE